MICLMYPNLVEHRVVGGRDGSEVMCKVFPYEDGEVFCGAVWDMGCGMELVLINGDFF